MFGRDQKIILEWLASFPEDRLVIKQSENKFVLDGDSEKTVPPQLTITWLEILEERGLLKLRRVDPGVPSDIGKPIEIAIRKMLARIEIYILPSVRALAVNDFQETAVSPRSYSNEEEATLLTAMNDLFSDEEIQELCFGMGIDYENIPGKTKRARIMGLIQEVRRNGRLLNLVARVIYARPGHNWIDALS